MKYKINIGKKEIQNVYTENTEIHSENAENIELKVTNLNFLLDKQNKRISP